MMYSGKDEVNNKKIRYYSFIIGDARYPQNWVLFDFKMVGVDVRSAITNLFSFIKTTYGTTHTTKRNICHYHMTKYLSPYRSQVDYFVRQVIEYERKYTPKKGYTAHVYGKIRVYNPQDFIHLFPLIKQRDINNKR